MGLMCERGEGFCDSMIHYIESLLQSRDFNGAIEYYEANRSQLDSADTDLQASILRHVARAHAFSGNYQAALQNARIAQARAAENGDTLILAEVFLTLGLVLGDMGEMKEAERAYRDAESIFRRQDCPEGQSRALNLLAGLFFRQNEFRNSLSLLMDAAEIVKSLDDRKKLAYIMGNIGRIYTFIGDFRSAEKHVQINIDLSSELNDEIEVAEAKLSMGYIHIQKGAFSDAESVLFEALPIIKKKKSNYLQVIYLTYLGELQYRANRLDESRETLNRALAMAEQQTSRTTLAGRVMRHLAELNIRCGNARLAKKYCAGAMVIMEEAGNKVEVAALYKIRGQVAASEKKSGLARKAFDQAINILDETGVRWEKAETLMAAASSGVFNERQSLTYLFRAEEHFAGCRLTDRLTETGKLIGSIEGSILTGGDTSSVERPVAPDVDYITGSDEIRRFKKQIKALGKSDLPLLLTGETGVGKDHMSRYFHSQVCPDKPYVAVNCASVPETLLESELFGYSKGAFTGAETDKPGMFAMAQGGVLYLDEIGEMPLALQAKLLGVLERRKVLPLGATREISLDFKLVTATNRDLEAMVEQGTFRRDLYYRLSGISFHIPALAERKEDIPLLLGWFMVKRGIVDSPDRVPSDLVRRFIGYDWPGNIRELDNKVKRLHIMAEMVAEGDLVELAHSLFGETDMPLVSQRSLFDRVEEFERQLISEALLASRGNKCEAARMLGIHEATVRTKLKRYGISYEQGVLRAQTDHIS